METYALKDTDVIIRQVTVDDASAVVKYLNIIGGESDFLTFGKNQFNKTVEEEIEYIKQTLQQPNALFLVAVVNQEVVGCLTFAGGLRERTCHVGELGLSVLKQYWSQGIGKALTTSLIDWAKTSNTIKKINLRVRSDNTKAIALYTKLGFNQEGIVQRDMKIDDEFFDVIMMGMLID